MIVFFGTDEFSLPSLKALIESRQSVLVVSKPDQRAGRGRQLTTPKVIDYAKKNGLDFIQLTDWSELGKKLNSTKPDWGLVVSFGRIIPNEILKHFPKGVLNIHPSLLPEYRGPSPIITAVMDGAKETGVSLMKITDQTDAGPVYMQQKLKLTGKESGPGLYLTLSKIGADLVKDNIKGILGGRLRPRPQDDAKATYTKLITKQDGVIDWSQSAQQIERQIRAFSGWPGAYTKIGGLEVLIEKAKATDQSGPAGQPFKISSRSFGIHAGQGSIEVLEIKPAGKNTMTAQGFLSGYGQRLFVN